MMGLPRDLSALSPIPCSSVTGSEMPRERQRDISLSFTQPAEALTGIALGTLNMLETLRRLGGGVRFYNAGSSECFGDIGPRATNERFGRRAWPRRRPSR